MTGKGQEPYIFVLDRYPLKGLTSILVGGTLVVAFVMLNVAPGEEEEVREQVSAVEGVEEVHVVYGIYDMVIKVAADAIADIKDIVTRKIRTLPEVRSTLTMIVVEK